MAKNIVVLAIKNHANWLLAWYTQFMQRIFLVRHGQKEPIKGDPALTELGQLQAQKTAEFLSQFPIQKIWSSPLLRTKQTAKQIADKTGQQVITHSAFRERLNWGDLPNQSFDDFLEMWNKTTLDRDFQPEGLDSVKTAVTRFEKGVAEALNNNDGHIVLVTHGGVVADFLQNLFTIEVLDQMLPGFGLMRENLIKECSITVLEKENAEPFRLIQLAGTQHLK